MECAGARRRGNGRRLHWPRGGRRPAAAGDRPEQPGCAQRAGFHLPHAQLRGIKPGSSCSRALGAGSCARRTGRADGRRGGADAKRAAAELRDLLGDGRAAGTREPGAVPDRNLALALARAHFELGRLLGAQGQAGEARAHWEAALALLPATAVPAWEAITLQARVLLAAGRLDEARALAGRLVTSAFRHPDVADLQQALAGGAGQRPGVAR